MKRYIEMVLSGENLTIDEMKQAARLIFKEETPQAAVGGFLTALRAKGESTSEMTGLAQVIREKAVTIPTPTPDVIDNCGTGGDHSQSFNISTTSAFVLAGSGLTVAKHGNRSISSKSGSADVLEALGVELSITPQQTSDALAKNKIAFLYAPHVHPAMKQVMSIRRDLAVPTIFNLIGPLTNPVQLKTQLLGVYRRDLLMTMAEVLQQLGRERALVINGAGYFDEATLAGENHCVLLENGKLCTFTIHPEEVGLPVIANDQLKGGDAKRNAEIMINVLEGNRGAYRDVILLNSGLGIFASGKATTIKEGIELAKESIDSGAALNCLKGMTKSEVVR